MPEIKYVVGSVWGRKEIVEAVGHNKYKQPMYMWRCSICGKVYGPRTGTDIARSPYSKCCPKRGMEKSNYLGFHDITGEYIAKVKASARSRGIAYEVTAEYLWGVWLNQGGRCTHTGRALKHGVDASLDRIDSTRGYVDGNVQWLHKNVNKIKWEMPEAEFLAICREIVDHTREISDGNGNCVVPQGHAATLTPGDNGPSASRTIRLDYPRHPAA